MKPDFIEIFLIIGLPVSFFSMLKVVYNSGKESGKEEASEAAQKEIEQLKAALKVAEDALNYVTEDFDCPAEDVAVYDMLKAKEALAKIKKIKKGLG